MEVYLSINENQQHPAAELAENRGMGKAWQNRFWNMLPGRGQTMVK
ncbi:hypothetical protein CLOBOL_07048 [Enterocloster bolteae ATCC BAA-613]|uniref:Uncharacterized protein n=1 Tax=Enterocloster bolteae (strain ATCC BAA-613 / DSM 15670 / CCUG 46953 / JCM 12243 / WAL 16351) TaxID=411902 RepID=A8S4Q8_ENTBW|nr:hypothetical protein CLOBOL_07048 [Enterocloster bolteae ATCC BAA-613]